MAATRVGLASGPGTTSFSVAAALVAFDDDRLRGLLRARPDLGERPPRTFAALADRVTAVPSVQIAYRRLDRAAQQVVEALCLLPRPVPVVRLAYLLGPGVEPPDLAAPLGRLEAAALVFRRDEELRLNPGLSSSLRHPAGLGPPATVALARQSVMQLGAICRRLGVRPSGTKARSLEAVAAALTDAGRVRDVVVRGPDGTVELAEQVAAGGPELSLPYGMHSANERTPVGWLLAHGLLTTLTWDRLVMPGEAGLALRGGLPFPGFSPHPPSVGTTSVDPARVGAVGAEQGLRLVADVAAVLESWSAQPPKLLKDGGIGIREVRRAAQAIDRDERDAARVVELAAVAGLAAADDRSGTALPLAAYDGWLVVDTPGRWARLVGGWLGADLHPSVAGALDLRDKRIPPLLPRGPEGGAESRRRMVLETLAEVAEGSAAEIGAVLARAGWAEPEAWNGGPASPATLVRWVIEEAELLGLAALGSLTGPGRLAVAGRMDEAVSAFAAHAPPSVSELVLQGDLTAVAAGALAPAVAAEMELLANVESRGAATVYRFSEASLGRAFDAGRSAPDVAAFLERHAASGVPQPLGYLVADLGRRYGRVRVATAGCYIRSDDPSLLSEVLHARAAARLRLRPLAPTVLASGADAGSTLATLRAAGYLPAAEDDTGALVLARPAAPRATPTPQVRRALPGGSTPGNHVDVASVVADLRRSAVPAPPPPAKPRAPSSPSHGTVPMWEPDDRPAAIAKDPVEVRALLGEACDQEWMVRLSYVNGKGREAQLNVVVTDVAGGRAMVDCHPRWDVKQLNVDRVHWARVLTEAEEVQLL